ncbi:unnamed protein product [Soboliphyme baturini]|uniref:Morc6_S5 domain-containing protein n=1 Tax=Soboliphyme baturini TaxID=241478 RepID=A0A183ITP0_9BILA|nr:unnamed protein product [Soboliphyme baturini]
MRIGKDFLLFTKKNDINTVLMLSRTFLAEKHLSEVVVPMPCYNVNMRPLHSFGANLERHCQEESIVFQYSPFHSIEMLKQQFDLIEGKSGTLVVVYNLRTTNHGEMELNFTESAHDFILVMAEESVDSTVPERKSLRAYLSILYLDPTMKIYLQDKKVETTKIFCHWIRPQRYEYSSVRFKTMLDKKAVLEQAAIDDGMMFFS